MHTTYPPTTLRWHTSEENPDAQEYLRNGEFSVEIGLDNPFGKILVDQAIEETVNKNTLTPGGPKCFNLKNLAYW